jgi:hypothetical protein
MSRSSTGAGDSRFMPPPVLKKRKITPTRRMTGIRSRMKVRNVKRVLVVF